MKTKQEILDYFNSPDFDEVRYLIRPVIERAYFQEWSGSGSPDKHHYGDGGLLRHTYEVVEYCRMITRQHLFQTGNEIKINELIIAAVWHDYGKIWDYQKDKDGVWGKHNDHARRIHHISRSAIEFSRIMDCLELGGTPNFKFDFDLIIHCILSHHGYREWGSPVSPDCKEAWILHLADSLSARLDDCSGDKF